MLYLAWRRDGRRGVGRALLGVAIPLGVVALLVGPGDLLFWAVAGNGSYFGLGTVSAYVAGLFGVMTFAFLACNLPIVWTIPWSWRHRVRGEDTDLWLWLLSAAISVAVGFRFFGHYYLQLLPPLALLTAGALSRLPRASLLASRSGSRSAWGSRSPCSGSCGVRGPTNRSTSA